MNGAPLCYWEVVESIMKLTYVLLDDKDDSNKKQDCFKKEQEFPSHFFLPLKTGELSPFNSRLFKRIKM